MKARKRLKKPMSQETKDVLKARKQAAVVSESSEAAPPVKHSEVGTVVGGVTRPHSFGYRQKTRLDLA